MVVPHQCRSNQRRPCSGLSGHVSRLALCFERAVHHRRLLVHSYALKAPHAVAQAKGSVRPMQCHRRQSGKQMVGCLRGEVRGAVNETRSETHLPCLLHAPENRRKSLLGIFTESKTTESRTRPNDYRQPCGRAASVPNGKRETERRGSMREEKVRQRSASDVHSWVWWSSSCRARWKRQTAVW